MDEASVEAAVARARALGVEGIVVAFINAYRNPANEHAAKAMIGRLCAGGCPVFCSSDVWPIIREYERTTTAVVHGYVQPRVARYLGSLQRALAGAGVPAEPLVTKSNGRGDERGARQERLRADDPLGHRGGRHRREFRLEDSPASATP